MPLQLFTGHFRGFSQNSTCWDGKAFHWSLLTSHCKAGRKCVEFTLSLSGSLPGKQKVFGLSAGLLRCLCRLGQPHGKVCLEFFIHFYYSVPIQFVSNVCVHIWPSLTATDLCIVPQITQQVGRCGPVAGAVDSAEMILCSQVVESLVRITCC